MTAHVKPHSPETLAAYWGCSAEKVRTMCRDGELASMYMCTSPPLPPPGRAVMGGLETLDLFSAAAGGWSLGLHRAGFTTIAACEAIDWRRAILRVEAAMFALSTPAAA